MREVQFTIKIGSEDDCTLLCTYNAMVDYCIDLARQFPNARIVAYTESGRVAFDSVDWRGVTC